MDDSSSGLTHYWEIEDKDVVVIPSLSFDTQELQSVAGVGHYEGTDYTILFVLALGGR